MDSLRAWIYRKVGGGIDLDSLAVLVGYSPSGLVKSWNKLIFDKDEFRTFINSNWSLTDEQTKALERTLNRFRPGLNESEAQRQLELARRRALVE